MTIEERLSALEQRISTMELQALAEETPTSYYTSKYSGEEIDEYHTRIDEGNLVIPSSTPSSIKRFRLKVDDTGIVTAEEVMA